MISYFLEAAVDANVKDILDFLERENRFIHPYNSLAKKTDEMNLTINFHSEIEDNTLSIYTKIYTTQAGKLYPRCYWDAPDGQGNEVISFEVTRLTDTRSLVKGSYADNHPHIELMFYRRWVRLGLAFDASFTDKAQIKLNELEQSEEKWEWHESTNTLFGNKVRYFSPSQKSQKQYNQILSVKKKLVSRRKKSMGIVNIFISYSHKDEELMNEVRRQLIPFERVKRIVKWYDREIRAGSELDREINERLLSAQIILLMLSPDFIESKYCYNVEMKNALSRHEQGEAVVIPIILRPCNWEVTPIGKLLALPKDGKPVTKWDDIDDATMNVAKGIMEVVDSFTQNEQGD